MIDGTNATNETENYGYPQFVAEDKPGWLTDWNKTMEAIDANEVGIQTQVTENKEDLEALEMTVERHEEELNGENGAFQRIADNQNRIQDLETKVGDDEHGLVKDMIDVKRDLTETNTMAVKTNGAVNSIRDLICNPFVSTSQYNAGAYVYLQDADDGEIHYYKCNTTHRGAFNPDHFDDVTEKLITALDNSGGGSGSQYVLPVAGSADDVDPLLGGVIIGDGLVIDPETGVLSTEGGGGGGGDVPYASKLQAGIMKPGNGLSDGHDNGTIDVMVDNDTIVINQETGRLEAHKQFTPQDLPVATDNTVGVVKGKSSLNNNEGKVNIANDGAMSVAIDNDYIKRKSDGSLTVNPEKIGSASGINVGEGLEKPDSNTIALKRGTPSQLGGWKPDARDFYKENDKDMIQLKPNGGLEHTSEGLAVVGGGGGGGTTYTEGDGIDITNDEISVKIKQNGGLAFDNGELYATGGGGTGSSILINPTLIAGYRSADDPRAFMGEGVYLETAQDIAAYNNLGYHIPTADYTLYVGRYLDTEHEHDSWDYEGKTIYQGVTHSIEVTRTVETEETDHVEYNVTIEEKSADADIYDALDATEVVRLFNSLEVKTNINDVNVNDSQGNQIAMLYAGVDIKFEILSNRYRDFAINNREVLFDIPVKFELVTSFDSSGVIEQTYSLDPFKVYKVYGVVSNPIAILDLQEINQLPNTPNNERVYYNRCDSQGQTYEEPFWSLMLNETAPSGSTPSDANSVGSILTIPESCKQVPCVLYYPFGVVLDSNTGGYTNPLANQDFAGCTCIMNYFVYLSNSNAPLTPNDYIKKSILLEKRSINISPKHFSDEVPGNPVEIVEPNAGNGIEGACIMVPPTDYSYIIVVSTLEVINLTTGTVQHFSSETPGYTGHQPFTMDGTMSLFKMGYNGSRQEYVDGNRQ